MPCCSFWSPQKTNLKRGTLKAKPTLRWAWWRRLFCPPFRRARGTRAVAADASPTNRNSLRSAWAICTFVSQKTAFTPKKKNAFTRPPPKKKKLWTPYLSDLRRSAYVDRKVRFFKAVFHPLGIWPRESGMLMAWASFTTRPTMADAIEGAPMSWKVPRGWPKPKPVAIPTG